MKFEIDEKYLKPISHEKSTDSAKVVRISVDSYEKARNLAFYNRTNISEELNKMIAIGYVVSQNK